MANGYDEAREALTGENPLQATVENLRRLLREAADTVVKERAEVARLRERDRQWEAATNRMARKLSELIRHELSGSVSWRGLSDTQGGLTHWAGAPEPLEEEAPRC